MSYVQLELDDFANSLPAKERLLVNFLRTGKKSVPELKVLFFNYGLVLSHISIRDLMKRINDRFKEDLSLHLIVIDQQGYYCLSGWAI